MPSEIQLPRLGWSMEEGTFVGWLKKEGETIKVGEPLFTLESEKAAQDVESTDSGILSIAPDAPQPGEVVKVGRVLGWLLAEGEAPPAAKPVGGPLAAPPVAATKAKSAPPPAVKQTPTVEAPASPRARRAARQLDVSLTGLQPTGTGGRIRERDVLQAAAASGARRPLSAMRRTIARRLLESKQTIPHFYVRQTVNAEALAAFHAGRKAQFPVSLNDIIVKAVAMAVRELPAFRSRLEGDVLVESPQANIGVAVGLEDGLVVPAVLNADQLSLRELAAETKRLVELARQRKIENAGKGVFTVTNLGMFGTEEFAGIINPPESAILAVGALREQPVVANGTLRAGKILTLTLSADHRIIDGAYAAKFMGRVKQILESPGQFLDVSPQRPEIQVQRAAADYDVAVIGSGPRGYIAALEAARLGAKTVVIEKSPHLRGTCLNNGCIPSKALLASGELLHRLEHAAALGVRVTGSAAPDWPAIQQRKDKILQTLRGGIQGLFKSRRVTLIRGAARFDAAGRLAIQNGGQTQTLTAGTTIVATGSSPARLGGWPADAARVCTSDEALHWSSLPASLLIVGGGVIGCEFACMMQAFGVAVTVVEMMPQLLPEMDEDLARQLQKVFAERGITIHTGTQVKELLIEGERCKAVLSNGSTVVADRTLVAVGRRPNTDALNLSAVGLTTDRDFLRADDRMRTTQRDVFCIGDANGRSLLAHAASAQALTAVHNALGKDEAFTEPIPAVVYTFPEVASVGLAEAKARAQAVPVVVGRYSLRHLGKAMAIAESDGFVKVVRHESSGELLGVHMIGHNATDCITTAVAMIRQRVSARDLAALIAPHPSMSESLKEAAGDAFGAALHAPPHHLEVKGATK